MNWIESADKADEGVKPDEEAAKSDEAKREADKKVISEDGQAQNGEAQKVQSAPKAAVQANTVNSGENQSDLDKK